MRVTAQVAEFAGVAPRPAAGPERGQLIRSGKLRAIPSRSWAGYPSSPGLHLAAAGPAAPGPSFSGLGYYAPAGQQRGTVG